MARRLAVRTDRSEVAEKRLFQRPETHLLCSLVRGLNEDAKVLKSQRRADWARDSAIWMWLVEKELAKENPLILDCPPQLGSKGDYLVSLNSMLYGYKRDRSTLYRVSVILYKAPLLFEEPSRPVGLNR